MAFGSSDNSVTVNITGNATGLGMAVQQAQSQLSGLSRNMQSLGGETEAGAGKIGMFLVNLASLMYVVQNVANAFEPLINAIERAGEEMFNLNVATERNVYNWRFLYGVNQSQQLAAWTQQFSMKIPYTRQDLMAAITRMGSQHFDVSQVESYLPVIADIASTQGRPGLNLQWATQAVVEAMMGRSMMLKMDLNINPAVLEKLYGYDPKNAQATLLPALERYAKARGEYGAAGQVATNTWWGLASSFVDRLQNFGLEAGGTDAKGNPIKGGMFAEMKGGLDDLSKWMDAHQKDIQGLADLIGGVLGGAVHDAKLMFDALVGSLEKTGVGKNIEGMFSGLTKWLNDPSTQHSLEGLATAFGKVAGVVGQLLGGGLGSIGSIFAGLFQGVGDSGAGNSFMSLLQNLANWLSDPTHQKQLKDFGDIVGQAWGTLASIETDLVNGVGPALGRFADVLNQLTNGHTAEDTKIFLAILGTLARIAATAIGGLVLTLADLAVIIADIASGEYITDPQKFLGDISQFKADIGNTLGQIGTAWDQGWATISDLVAQQSKGAGERMDKAFQAGVTEHLTRSVAQTKGLLTQVLQQLFPDKATAKKWGGDFIQNLIDGMLGKTPELQKQAGLIAAAVARFFKHSTPEEGPLHGDDQWMDHLVAQFATSLHNGVPVIAAASQRLAGAVATPLHAATHGGSGGGGAGGSGGGSHGPSTVWGDTTQHNHFYGSTEAMMERIVARKLAERDREGGMMRRQPGVLAVIGAWGAGRGGW
ncbi:MAG TPA: hypothetical protein VKQ30_01220 [Ktedonobacterales bacterium]|nr:hypothetical protein [Ktedonobacterales bacterium]